MDSFSKHKDTPKYVTALAHEMRVKPTQAEEMLWRFLSNKQLNGVKFRRQFPIDRYIVDFYSHHYNLVNEIDGDIHNNQIEYDSNRTKFIESSGFTIIRFTNEQVLGNIELVIKQIKENLV